MHQDDPDLDQRLSRFEAQLDRFSLTLHQWQQAQERIQSSTPRDVDQRIRTLEETIDREAHALRRMHEEPLKQLQAQTASLRDICIAASHSVNGLDQAESHLAALQADLHLHLNELGRDLQALAAGLRTGRSGTPASQAPAASWPLEQVVHLHNELRRGSDGHSAPAPAPPRLEAPEPVAAYGYSRPDQTIFAERQEPFSSTGRHFHDNGRRYLVGALIVAAAVVVGVVALAVERRIEARLNEAAAHVTAAEDRGAAAAELANHQIASAREAADRQIAEARESAQRAETIGGILTAPDLVRFNLFGNTTVERSSAQVLWSRTRGLVLSGSRLPAPAPDTTYQLWLLTNTQPVSAGLFVPDPTGKATLVVDQPPPVIGAVIGASVTVEPSGGQDAPSGPIVLARPAPAPTLQP